MDLIRANKILITVAILLFGLPLYPSNANAGIYKGVGPDGHVTYSNDPLPGFQKLNLEPTEEDKKLIRKEKARAKERRKKLQELEDAEIKKLEEPLSKAKQNSSLVCVGEKSCKKYFQLTQLYITKNSDMKLQVVTDTVIETYNPIELLKIGIKATKSPSKGDSERIDLEVVCKSVTISSACMRKELSIYEQFRPFIETSLR